MVNQSLLQSSLTLTSAWVRLWCYIVAVGMLLIGVNNGSNEILIYGVIAILVGAGIQVFGALIQRLQPISDNYAASVHRTMIERFFVQQEQTQEVTNLIPEIISRTTFNRPSKTRPLREAYQSLTVVVTLVTIAVVLYELFNSEAVYAFSLSLFLIYATDRLFGLRSALYFRTQQHTPEKDTTHISEIVEVFSQQLELDEKPEVIYSQNEDFIAGATNPLFRKPQLYISTSLLEKQKHIQNGILSHEMAHLKLDETKTITHKYIQALIPIVLAIFASVPLSVYSVSGLAVTLFVIVVCVAMQRHREEFEADLLASGLTKVEFIVLAVLEFTNFNPFVDSLPFPFDLLSQFVNTHPPIEERIERLLGESGQTFNSEQMEFTS